MKLGMGDRRALANLIAQDLMERFNIISHESDAELDEFALTNEIAKKVSEFFGEQ